MAKCFHLHLTKNEVSTQRIRNIQNIKISSFALAIFNQNPENETETEEIAQGDMKQKHNKNTTKLTIIKRRNPTGSRRWPGEDLFCPGAAPTARAQFQIINSTEFSKLPGKCRRFIFRLSKEPKFDLGLILISKLQ